MAPQSRGCLKNLTCCFTLLLCGVCNIVFHSGFFLSDDPQEKGRVRLIARHPSLGTQDSPARDFALRKVNSMNLLMYMAPVAAIFLIPAVLIMEKDVVGITIALAKQDVEFLWYLIFNSSLAYFTYHVCLAFKFLEMQRSYCQWVKSGIYNWDVWLTLSTIIGVIPLQRSHRNMSK
ncbi:hypothetical protein CUMW_285890 [Citrus unshiu]|uniref:Uncharacterized protein n=1 Tax=Citrus unshiu TaxID=55188 RepID=A0A2H5N2E4_CITUN|nr:hypothetical protein CUMW_285890 [Citrus unshiu]